MPGWLRLSTSTRTNRGLQSSATSQRLQRGWSGFQNFAISFTIISVFAGTFTTYGQAWNYGGPIAISIGWPVICGLILLVAFSMSELASKYPTAGGSTTGPRPGRHDLGLVHGLVQLHRPRRHRRIGRLRVAHLPRDVLSLYKLNSRHELRRLQHVLSEIFLLFVVILTIHALINIYSSPLVATAQQHLGLLARDRHRGRDRDPRLRPRSPSVGQASSSPRSSTTRASTAPTAVLLVLHPDPGLPPDDVHADRLRRVGARLRGDARRRDRRRQGRLARRSSGRGLLGWFVLLALTFAATDVKAVNAGGGSSLAIIDSALLDRERKFVVIIATVGQLFCGMACVTALAHVVTRSRATARFRAARTVDAGSTTIACPPTSVICSCVARADRSRCRRSRATPTASRARSSPSSRSRDRPLHRLRHADLPALADGRRVRAGSVDAREEVQVDQPGAIIWVAICVVSSACRSRRPACPWRGRSSTGSRQLCAESRVGGHRRLIEGVWRTVVAGPDPRRSRCPTPRTDPEFDAPAAGVYVSRCSVRSSGSAPRSSGRAGACGTTRRCCCSPRNYSLRCSAPARSR